MSLRRSYVSRVLLAALVVFPLVAGAYYAFAAPRPYDLMQTDIEADYYYNARLAYAGQDLVGTYHPGTPVYYLGALVMQLTSADVHQAQQFFNATYVIIALLTALALGVALWLLRRSGAPPGVAGLAIAAAMAWPPFLTYLNYFGSDAFIVAAGLPTLALFWYSLHQYRRACVALLGAAAGLCLSIKLSFLPFVVVLGAAVSLHVLRHDRWTWLAAFPGAAVAAFALGTLPVLDHMPGVLALMIVGHSQTSAGRVAGAPSRASDLGVLAEALGPFLLIGAGAALLIVGSSIAFCYRRSLRAFVHRAWNASDERFDAVAAGCFALLGAVVFGYLFFSVGSRFDDPGIALRNVSPSALVVPFLVLLAWKGCAACARRPREGRRAARFAGQAGLLLASITLVGYAFVSHASSRHDAATQLRAQARATQEAVQAHTVSGARVAVWDGRWGRTLGPVGFHFWGDYRYAREHFNEELLRAFPQYVMIRMRHLRPRGVPKREVPASLPEDDDEGLLPDDGWLNRAYRYLIWRRWNGQRLPRGPVVAADVEPEVRVLVFPESRERPQALARMRRRLGPLQVHRDSIAGDDWIIAYPRRATSEVALK